MLPSDSDHLLAQRRDHDGIQKDLAKKSWSCHHNEHGGHQGSEERYVLPSVANENTFGTNSAGMLTS